MGKLIKKTLLQKYQRHIIEEHKKQLYSVGMSAIVCEKVNNAKNDLELYKLVSECIKCDKELPVSFGSGMEIERLVEGEKNTIGFYHTSFDKNELVSTKVNNILNDGVQVANYTFNSPHLEKSLYFPEDIIEAMDVLKTDVKDSKIVFILKFPAELVEVDGGYSSFNDVFNATKDGVYIKPEFIDSYVILRKGILNRIENNEFAKKLIQKKPTA